LFLGAAMSIASHRSSDRHTHERSGTDGVDYPQYRFAKGSGTTRAVFHYGHDGHQNNADDLSVVGARSPNKGQAITEEDTAMIKA